MHNKIAILFIVGVATTFFGCSPRVRVRKAPGADDIGIRYYRPKPYLKITPAGSVVREGKVSTTIPSDEFVAISLEYLPDFSEEYSIEVCAGLGSATVDIELQDGWNLTKVDQDLDSEFDENVKAIAELASAATGFVPTAKDRESAPVGSTQKFVVAATNVPIGYYESVISKDACGTKRLYGFRYVGFLPFSPCPTEMCGADHRSCHGVPSDLYGVVFEEGVMRFKRLDSIEHGGSGKRISVSTGTTVVSGDRRSLLTTLESAVQRAVLEIRGLNSKVRANLIEDGSKVAVSIGLDQPGEYDPDLIQDVVAHEGVELSLQALGDPSIEFRSAAKEEETDFGQGVSDDGGN